MKKLILSLTLFAMFAVMTFAGDILPELNDYGRSILPGDAVLVSVFPNTPEAARLLLRLHQGDHNLIVTERVIDPSKNSISSSRNDAEKMHALVALAAKMRAYVRGEVYTIISSEDDASSFATEISSTILFAEILQNSKEELRLTYSFRNSDGTTGFFSCFWLSAEKALIDSVIQETTAAYSSGTRRTQRTSDVQKSSTMTSNERIARLREENRFFGFGE